MFESNETTATTATAAAPTGIDQLLALDSGVTIGTNSRGIVLATCTSWNPVEIMAYHRMQRGGEYTRRYKTDARRGDAFTVDLNTARSMEVYLTPGTVFGFNKGWPVTLVFPAAAVTKVLEVPRVHVNYFPEW